MFDLMQYALIFYDFQLILARMGAEGPPRALIQIGSATARPDDAFAAVRYRNYWFAIDDHDMPSKRLFTFLMFLFTLVETSGKEGAPIVTIPAQ